MGADGHKKVVDLFLDYHSVWHEPADIQVNIQGSLHHKWVLNCIKFQVGGILSMLDSNGNGINRSQMINLINYLEGLGRSVW